MNLRTSSMALFGALLLTACRDRPWEPPRYPGSQQMGRAERTATPEGEAVRVLYQTSDGLGQVQPWCEKELVGHGWTRMNQGLPGSWGDGNLRLDGDGTDVNLSDNFGGGYVVVADKSKPGGAVTLMVTSLGMRIGVFSWIPKKR